MRQRETDCFTFLFVIEDISLTSPKIFIKKHCTSLFIGIVQCFLGKRLSF